MFDDVDDSYCELERVVHEQTLFTIASRRPFEVMYETVEKLRKDSGNSIYTFGDFKNEFGDSILDSYNGCDLGNHNSQYVAFRVFYQDVFEADLNPGMIRNYLTGGE